MKLLQDLLFAVRKIKLLEEELSDAKKFIAQQFSVRNHSNFHQISSNVNINNEKMNRNDMFDAPIPVDELKKGVVNGTLVNALKVSPFECSYCHQSFSLASNRSAHVNTTHFKIRKKCLHCDKTYTRRVHPDLGFFRM